MEFKEFQQLTKRTLPRLHEIYKIREDASAGVNELFFVTENKTAKLPNILDLIHMNLGIVSELNELIDAINSGDRVNIAEELADQLWYIANDLTINKKIGLIDEGTYLHFSNFKFTSEIQATTGGWDADHQWLICDIYCASKLADMNKRFMAYGNPPDVLQYTKHINYLLTAINNIASSFSIDLRDAMGANIEKLKVRFPNKFDAVIAVDRNLGAERIALEAGSPTGSLDTNAPLESIPPVQ